MVSNKKFGKNGYGLGALIVFVASIGVASIVYGGGILIFEPVSLIAWVFGSLGAYTIIYALRMRGEFLYYLSWGLIMLDIGLASALYKTVNFLVMFGFLLIILVVIGSITYWRKKK